MEVNPLKSGDKIGICAPASHFDPDKFKTGVHYLESLGFKVLYDQNIFQNHRYLAGTDQSRLKQLVDLLSNPEIKAIFFARGGYGSMRLLADLDPYKSKFTPKIICGYSDITALFQYFRFPCFYGPVISGEIHDHMDESTQSSLLKLLQNPNEPWNYNFPSPHILKSGSVKAPIEGGCLSIISSLQGTPYEIDLQNKIFFFEDIHEKPYQVDRMLTQLKLAGKFESLKGVLVGSLHHPEIRSDYYIEVLEDIFSEYDIPILINLPFGHIEKKQILPLGCHSEIIINSDSAQLKINPLL